MIFCFFNIKQTSFALDKANNFANNDQSVINTDKKQINILSLDGGGVKSITSLKIVEYIENKTGKKITDLFDVVDGTSSGGILALYLTMPESENSKVSKYKASDIIKLFESDSRRIFKPRPISMVVPTCVLQAFMPAYETKNPEDVFFERFKNTRLSNSVVDTIILSFSPENARPFLFNSNDKLTNDTLIKDVAVSTVSAPFYFSPMKYENKACPDVKTLIDGGLITKNPSLLTYLQLKKLYPNAEINIVSIGAGIQNKDYYNYKTMKTWGFAKLVVPTLTFMLDGGTNTVDEYMKQLIDNNGKDHYYRFQIPLNSKVDGSNNRMDDPSEKNLAILKGIAGKYIIQHKTEIDTMINQIQSVKNVAATP